MSMMIYHKLHNYKQFYLITNEFEYSITDLNMTGSGHSGRATKSTAYTGQY